MLEDASRRSAILITSDKDFGELVFRQGRVSEGVVLVRLEGLSPEAKAEITSNAIREHGAEMPGNFVVLSPGTLRIRRGFSRIRKHIIPATGPSSDTRKATTPPKTPCCIPTRAALFALFHTPF